MCDGLNPLSHPASGMARHSNPQAGVRTASGSHSPHLGRPACEAGEHRGERLLLTLDTLALHGSTALLASFFGNPRVATLCEGRTWECESQPTKEAARAQRSPHLDAAQIWADALRRFAPFWREHGRASAPPVLVAKWEPLHSMMASAKASATVLPPDRVPVPPLLAGAGVQHVRWAAVAMHQPWCMTVGLSSYAGRARQRSLKAWAAMELLNRRRIVDRVRFLEARGVPLLVTSHAELLWRPDRFVAKILAFAPCAGRLNLSHIPRLGADHFQANALKVANESVRGFGERRDPRACCNMTATQHPSARARCAAPAEILYAGLDEAGRALAQELDGFMESRVRLRWELAGGARQTEGVTAR
ncbi:hypothetical protein EMIHUDRAFT_233441 [Emiliania huxleyi CCMP1516]|uniref:Uncharacterized protein n=2 Tax=Emiliania huxleyi TaxID=2903 RepID=A0A0D3K283_EMIH1|nr:hypothetical protein EMIHUDRAFT_233441 [Emiliania huxleyi CCMP1516]EOD29868.1 hypothetical protein EMIHUDRAFT_233441 [Emiliania huxleyi CCMP1516]|eukprot:XP_005782297.1 hypothetical protein EMIHUDRAFT_233441 [Emiliania huxleyi CCMP1516]